MSQTINITPFECMARTAPHILIVPLSCLSEGILFGFSVCAPCLRSARIFYTPTHIGNMKLKLRAVIMPRQASEVLSSTKILDTWNFSGLMQGGRSTENSYSACCNDISCDELPEPPYRTCPTPSISRVSNARHQCGGAMPTNSK